MTACRAGKRAILADVSGTLAARKWARWLPISYALFAGLLGTQSVLYGKTVSMLLRTTLSGDSQLVRNAGWEGWQWGGAADGRRWALANFPCWPQKRPILDCSALQANWYFWLSLCLVITFAGFWMSRYSKAMKLFPVLIVMPLIQVRPELALR